MQSPLLVFGDLNLTFREAHIIFLREIALNMKLSSIISLSCHERVCLHILIHEV